MATRPPKCTSFLQPCCLCDYASLIGVQFRRYTTARNGNERKSHGVVIFQVSVGAPVSYRLPWKFAHLLGPPGGYLWDFGAYMTVWFLFMVEFRPFSYEASMPLAILPDAAALAFDLPTLPCLRIIIMQMRTVLYVHLLCHLQLVEFRLHRCALV